MWNHVKPAKSCSDSRQRLTRPGVHSKSTFLGLLEWDALAARLCRGCWWGQLESIVCVCVSVNIWRLNWPGVLHEHYPLHLQMFRDFMKISIVACHRARNAHAEQACLRCIDWLLAEREAAAVQWMPQLSQRPCHATSWSAWVCLKLYETMVPPQIWCLMHCWSSCSITFPHISAWKTAFLCHRDENLS